MTRKLLALSVALVLAAAAALAWYARTPLELATAEIDVSIERGSSFAGVARTLTQAGVLPEPWRFRILGRLLGRARDIKAGNYVITGPVAPLDLMDRLTRGSVRQVEVRIIEGWTLAKARRELDGHERLRHDTAGLADAALAPLIGAAEGELEGLLFPDTYFVAPGTSDTVVLRLAYRLMKERLAEAWVTRAPGLPYATPYEALTLASIVEKEAGVGHERPLIAGVFVNRLKRGMRLQTDPTVIYGMGERFDGNIRRADLLTDTPWNTYTRDGLPPTPIALPGAAAIRAALNPARGNAIYFVARGDGTHHFSATLDEHNRAVARYQKNR